MFFDSGPTVVNLGDAVRFGSVVVLGIVSYFLRRSMATIDGLEQTVHKLDKKVEVLLDRDRRKRLEDYSREQPPEE